MALVMSSAPEYAKFQSLPSLRSSPLFSEYFSPAQPKSTETLFESIRRKFEEDLPSELKGSEFITSTETVMGANNTPFETTVYRRRRTYVYKSAPKVAMARAMDPAMAKLLEKAGAKAGLITISLMWNHPVDLDTEVVCFGPPSKGSKIVGTIKHSSKKVGKGKLDIDMTTGGGSGGKVENVFWEEKEPGSFKYSVQHYSSYTSPVDYQVCLQSQIPIRLFNPTTDETINPSFVGVWNFKGTFGKKEKQPVIAWEVVLSVDEEKAQVEEEIKALLQKSEITFDSNSASLKDQGKRVCVTVAEKLKQLPPGCTIKVSGHTDCGCSVADCVNIQLATSRCDNIIAKLKSEGVSADFMPQGWGCKEPIIGRKRLVRILID